MFAISALEEAEIMSQVVINYIVKCCLTKTENKTKPKTYFNCIKL